MGQYNKAILTAAGENLIARTLAGEIQLNITKAKTSNYIYPVGTDFKSLTDMQGIKQTATDPATVVYNDTMIQTRVLFSNEEIVSTYYIHNIGLYAMDGTQEVLFCIVTADTPDEMPQYNGVASTSYIYNIQNVVQDATDLNITVNPSGTATIQDVLERVDTTGGDISETVIETLDTVEDKYPIPTAGESVKRFFGKVLTFMKNIRPLTSDITLYVSTTGSDILGDGTQSKPFKSPQHAIDIIPKDLGGHTAVVNVSDGIYQEDMEIKGFSNGILQIRSSTGDILSDNCKINRIIAYWNTCGLIISGFNIMTTTDAGIYADSCINLNIHFTRITQNALASGKDGMLFSRCIFSVWNCQVSYRNKVMYAYSSHGVSRDWVVGTGNINGLWSSYGSVITTVGTQPTATKQFNHDDGGAFTYDNGTQISDITSLGLTCTWGTIRSAGYARNGNSNGGVAQVIIDLNIIVTAPLTQYQQYFISGFPRPLNTYGVSVDCHQKKDFEYCIVNYDGQLELYPAVNIIANQSAYSFSAVYLTNV